MARDVGMGLGLGCRFGVMAGDVGLGLGQGCRVAMARDVGLLWLGM